MKSIFIRIALVTIVLGASSLNFKADAQVVEYYGSKSGLFTPCRGDLVSVCKRISPANEIQTGDYDGPLNTIIGRFLSPQKPQERYVIIEQGGRKVTVLECNVNFKDGSVKE